MNTIERAGGEDVKLQALKCTVSVEQSSVCYSDKRPHFARDHLSAVIM